MCTKPSVAPPPPRNGAALAASATRRTTRQRSGRLIASRVRGFAGVLRLMGLGAGRLRPYLSRFPPGDRPSAAVWRRNAIIDHALPARAWALLVFRAGGSRRVGQGHRPPAPSASSPRRAARVHPGLAHGGPG